MRRWCPLNLDRESAKYKLKYLSNETKEEKMKKREVKSQKQEQNGHKKGARNKRGGLRMQDLF
jgi:hypothetical protein